MVKTPRYLLDLAIGAALLAMIVLVLAAWPLREPAAASANEAGFTPTAATQTSAGEKKPSAAFVAGVFGYHAPAPAAPRETVRPAPVETAPVLLHYMGYVTAENGLAKYYFKDGQSGEVLTLYLGKDNGHGWKLTSITSAGYTIEHNGTVIKVPK